MSLKGFHIFFEIELAIVLFYKSGIVSAKFKSYPALLSTRFSNQQFWSHNLVPHRNTEKSRRHCTYEDMDRGRASAERLVLSFPDGKIQQRLRLNWPTCSPVMQTDRTWQ